MKKISNLSVLLGLSLAATATGVNAETQTQMQAIAPVASTAAVEPVKVSIEPSKDLNALSLQASNQPSKIALDVKEAAPVNNESATIRAINTELNRPKAIAQNVTSVSQLSDVRPTDWAFTALQSLVERYGCIAGYPDRTFRGNQATSRYEFAAGLNACLDKINEIISAGLADKVSKEDLATLQKLQEEFAAELATLRGRVDALDAKTAKLEAQQFSTTTKLSGLAFFNVTGASGANVLRENVDPTTAAKTTPLATKPNITMSGLVWLTLNTSFTGKDSLITQLAVGNGSSPYNSYTSSGFFNTTGTPFTDQTAGAAANTFVLRELSYTFPVFEKATLVVGPRVNFYKYFDGIRFIYPWNTTFNSINSTLLTNAKRGAGAVFMTPLGNQFDFKIGYLSESNEFGGTGSAASPTQGLFGGNNALTAELGFKPSDAFKFRLLYSRTNLAPNANGTVGGAGFTPSLPGTVAGANNAQSDVFVANFDWLVSKGFGLFGRYGYGTTNVNLTAGGSSNVVMQTFQVGAAFPDLFKEGAQAMISFGMPFNFTSGKSSLISGGGDGGTQYDLELSYIYPVTKNISLVPSAYFIFSPNNFNSNPTIFVGNLQAVFSF
ncbi:carbohydrate porin [Pseudanabaena sp. FACHB-1277]|uniref:Carbohydrate porin n=1 Tax=Pseudanabaena cinerea FACHB-1277 TaxID=2949581 RepID=A0A926UVY0_9CYAN|nr:iron uptake porin [Pseudanabaena cinerea]MBD2151813.1 carbohydrate porin [Pseudanabaena cinerea FACHB-1277]